MLYFSKKKLFFILLIKLQQLWSLTMGLFITIGYGTVDFLNTCFHIMWIIVSLLRIRMGDQPEASNAERCLTASSMTAAKHYTTP